MKSGYFGKFGGRFVNELYFPALVELERAFRDAKKDTVFGQELTHLLRGFAGRPTPLYFANNLSEFIGCRVFLKREDVLHGGSHKLNNALGQVLLAKKMGKKRIITETAAGMHGVASCLAGAVLGMPVEVFMGVKDIARQTINADRITLLGGIIHPVARGAGVLKDAVSEAMSVWISDLPNTHYLIGSTVGPCPYPEIVTYFQKIIGEETKRQLINVTGPATRQPQRHPQGDPGDGAPRLVSPVGAFSTTIIACGSGGSNATGIFSSFVNDTHVELVFVEGAEAAAFTNGSIGVFQGTKTYVLQDEFGMDRKTTSRSAGLNYPARGPYLSYLFETGRMQVATATNAEIIETFKTISQMEGIIPAFETCHALTELLKRKGMYKADDVVVVCFSGNGEKDIKNI